MVYTCMANVVCTANVCMANVCTANVCMANVVCTANVCMANVVCTDNVLCVYSFHYVCLMLFNYAPVNVNPQSLPCGQTHGSLTFENFSCHLHLSVWFKSTANTSHSVLNYMDNINDEAMLFVMQRYACHSTTGLSSSDGAVKIFGALRHWWSTV